MQIDHAGGDIKNLTSCWLHPVDACNRTSIGYCGSNSPRTHSAAAILATLFVPVKRLHVVNLAAAHFMPHRGTSMTVTVMRYTPITITLSLVAAMQREMEGQQMHEDEGNEKYTFLMMNCMRLADPAPCNCAAWRRDH